MNFWRRWLGENRLTAFMLFFVVVLYSFLMFMAAFTKPSTAPSSIKAQQNPMLTSAELKQKEEVVRKSLMEKPRLMSILSLAFFGTLVWGILLDMLLIHWRREKRPWISTTLPKAPVCWNMNDVFQALVLLFFIEGCLFLFQLFGYWLTGLELSPDFLLLTNSLIRDVAAAVFVLLLVARRQGRPFADLGLRREKAGLFVKTGLLAYVAIVPLLVISFIVLGFFLQVFSYEPAPQNVVQMYLKPSSENYLIFFTVFVAGIGPVLEEIFFRGFAFAALRQRLGFWKAAALTSFLFSMFHMNAVVFVPIFFLGLFLCYLYESTGSLVPSISAHILHNTIMVLMTLGFRFLSQ